MAVYVDDMDRLYRGMLMSHMIADTTEELLAMVDAIGVDRKWLQCAGAPKEHFDISKVKKEAALKLGAVQITWRQLGEMVIVRTKSSNLVLYTKTEKLKAVRLFKSNIDQVQSWCNGLKRISTKTNEVVGLCVCHYDYNTDANFGDWIVEVADGGYFNTFTDVEFQKLFKS